MSGIYLAAPYGSRELIRTYAAELRDRGFTITSSWLDEKHEINAGTTGAATALSDQQVSEHAVTDIREVRAADALVLFTAAAAGCEGGGGRHVETGVALALGKPVYVVGAPENVFHRIVGGVTRVADWEGLLDALTCPYCTDGVIDDPDHGPQECESCGGSGWVA